MNVTVTIQIKKGVMITKFRSRSAYPETPKYLSDTPPASFVDRVNRVFNTRSGLKKTDTNLYLNLRENM
jgi:hypothetical protein